MDDNNIADIWNGLDLPQTTTIITETLPGDLTNQTKSIPNVNKNPQIVENELFISLKFHIDSQYKLNQLNRSRIRSYERFRNYCHQQATQFGDGTGEETDKFDDFQKQFQNEYNKFDRNYQYWRRRIRKLRKEIKCSLSPQYQNPYDILYQLFVKIECSERSRDNLNDTKKCEDQYLSNDKINVEQNKSSINILDNIPVNSRRRKTQDQSIQYDIKDFCDSTPEKSVTTKRPRGRPPKTKYLSADLIYPEISLNVIEPSTLSSNSRLKKVRVNKDSEAIDSDFSIEDIESSNNSSDSSFEIYKAKKSTRGRKPVAKTRTKSIVSKTSPKKGNNKKSSKTTKYNQKKSTASALKQQEQWSDSDFASIPKKAKKKKPKTPKLYECDFEDCQYSTTNSWTMNLHRRTHSDARPFQCDKCDSAFKIKAELKRHQNIHEGVRFHCTFEGCTANFATKRRVQKHIKIIHTKEAPLLHCDWEGCQYSTYRSECLKTHRKIHDGNRPYKCPHCELAFNSPSNLWSHKLKHENGNIWKCDFEGCAYSSYRNSYLKIHKLIHNEDRPFTCAWPGCGDSFKTPTGLGKHKLMHENLRRYKCTWDGCDYACNISGSLRRHVESVHEKKKRIRIRKRPNNSNNNNKRNLLDSSLEFTKPAGSSSQLNHNNMTNCNIGPDIYTVNNNNVDINSHSTILQLL